MSLVRKISISVVLTAFLFPVQQVASQVATAQEGTGADGDFKETSSSAPGTLSYKMSDLEIKAAAQNALPLIKRRPDGGLDLDDAKRKAQQLAELAAKNFKFDRANTEGRLWIEFMELQKEHQPPMRIYKSGILQQKMNDQDLKNIAQNALQYIKRYPDGRLDLSDAKLKARLMAENIEKAFNYEREDTERRLNKEFLELQKQ